MRATFPPTYRACSVLVLLCVTAGAAPAAEAKKESSEEGSDESMGGLFD